MKQAKLLTDMERKRVHVVINSRRYAQRNQAIFALSFYAGAACLRNRRAAGWRRV